MLRDCRCALAVLAAMVPWLLGCGQRNVFQPLPPPTVTVAQPVEREVVDWVEFTGNTRAPARVELRSRVKGYLQHIHFKDGAQVKQGDLLFVIEKAPFEAELEAARAELARAKATVQLAQANLARTSQLVASRAASQQQLDVHTAELATARASERAAQASVTQAELNLSYTEIRAPISGRIGRHLLDVGNLVLPDQSLLAIIESIDPMHAYFYLSENELLRFMEMRRQNQLPDPETDPPELELALNGGEFQYRGVLDFRELGVDPATGTVERRGVFPNPNFDLVPGMFVRLRAAIGSPRPKVLVDERALGADQRGDFVLVVDDKNVVEHRPVKLGIQTDGLRVVEQGLALDEWVIVNGLQRARPGAPVTPERATDSPQAASVSPAPAERQETEQPQEAGQPQEAEQPQQQASDDAGAAPGQEDAVTQSSAAASKAALHTASSPGNRE